MIRLASKRRQSWSQTSGSPAASRRRASRAISATQASGPPPKLGRAGPLLAKAGTAG